MLLGCGSPDRLFLVPFEKWESLLHTFHITQQQDRMYWHVKVVESGGRFELARKGEFDRVDLSKYLVVDS